MDSLFDESARRARAGVAPLAARMRPRSLDEFVGQRRAVGEGTWLRRAITSDALSSVILFGPAGTGKTSLARIVAASTGAHFEEVSAVTSGVGELRRAIEGASDRLTLSSRRTVLFIDEIHRFNKTQQDALLHAVEDRIIVLIGATTENPYFEVNSPLLSRSRVVELEPLGDDDVSELVKRAVRDERGLADVFVLEEDALDAIVTSSGGDARVALTTLELAAECTVVSEEDVSHIVFRSVSEAMPARILTHDKQGDAHYDVVSAFIKSIRGSDPDAAVYWLARMIEGGEDPRFIARRMMILASEDIGNADPQALFIAHAAFHAAQFIGWPECRINLAQAAIYLALAPKSNACYLAIDAALDDVRTGPARQVPSHLRDRHRPGAEHYGHYLYPHDDPGGVVDQQYLPDGLAKGCFFRPTPRDEMVSGVPKPPNMPDADQES